MNNTATPNEREIALVGAGPVGIEVAVALKKAGLDYVHFDAGQVGQTVYNFPSQTRFFSSSERIAIAGVPLQTIDQGKCTREQYLAYLRGIVQMHDLPIHTYERVESIQRQDESFLLETEHLHGKSLWRVRKLILSTGGTARPRWLDIPGEDQPNVHHHFVDPHVYFRRKVLVVGGRNSAVEAAIRCYHAGAEVAFSYRRDKFDSNHIKYWLYPEITGLTHSGKIAGHFNTVPTRFEMGMVSLRDVVTGKESQIEADFLLVLIGYCADMRLAEMAGVELQGDLQCPLIDQHTMQTNVPGVFIAGTAVAGTQDQFRIFIENCHDHCEKIVATLQGKKPHAHRVVEYLRPES